MLSGQGRSEYLFCGVVVLQRQVHVANAVERHHFQLPGSRRRLVAVVLAAGQGLVVLHAGFVQRPQPPEGGAQLVQHEDDVGRVLQLPGQHQGLLMIVQRRCKVGRLAVHPPQFPHGGHPAHVVVPRLVARQQLFEFFHLLMGKYRAVHLLLVIAPLRVGRLPLASCKECHDHRHQCASHPSAYRFLIIFHALQICVCVLKFRTKVVIPH